MDPVSLFGAGYCLIEDRGMGFSLANSLLSAISGLPAELPEGFLSLKEQGKRGRLCVNKFPSEGMFSQSSV